MDAEDMFTFHDQLLILIIIVSWRSYQMISFNTLILFFKKTLTFRRIKKSKQSLCKYTHLKNSRGTQGTCHHWSIFPSKRGCLWKEIPIRLLQQTSV